MTGAGRSAALLPLALLACAAPDRAPGDSDADTGDTAGEALPAGVERLPTTPCVPGEGAAWFDERPVSLTGQPTGVAAGFGLGVGDLDADGLRDLLVLHSGAVAAYRQTEAGDFAPHALPGLDAVAGVDAVSLHDVDLDGDDDLLVSHEGRLTLLVAEDGAYAVAAAAGLPEDLHTSQSLVWADFDGDDQLDLFLGDDALHLHGGDAAGVRSRLLRRVGPLAFEPWPLPDAVAGRFTKASPAVDLDGDDDLDLYLDNHGQTGNLVLENVDGAFVVRDTLGLTLTMSGMGGDLADLNGDARPDLLLSDAGPPRLLVSLDDGSWVDVAQASGLGAAAGQTEGWGTVLADFDHDADLDAAMAWGPNLGEDEDQPGSLWENLEGAFVARAAPGPPQAGVSLAAVDLDLDGHLDLVQSPNNQPAALFRGACRGEAWVTLAVRGSAGNPTGIGARVQVEAGGQVQTRWLTGGGTSYVVSLPVEAHLGLGGATRLDRVTVRLAGVERSWEDLPVNVRLRLDLEG